MTTHHAIIQEAIRRALTYGHLMPGKRLNEAQAGGLAAHLERLGSGGDPGAWRRGYYDMATGLGKTGIMGVVSRFAFIVAQERGLAGNFRIVALEPTISLLGQTAKSIAAIAPELADGIRIFGGGSKDFGGLFNILTWPAYIKMLEEGSWDYGNILLQWDDESHHGLSSKRQSLRSGIEADTHFIGLTATAEYDPDKTMQLTHEHLIYRMDLRTGIERRLLTDYAHVQFARLRIRPSILTSDLNGRERQVLRYEEWNKVIERVLATGHDEVSDQRLHDKVATLFCANTRQADSLADRLNRNPILREVARRRGMKAFAVSIHSVDVSTAEQRRRMEDFESGQCYMAATGDKKFKEGFDIPRIKFVASFPEDSLVDLIQGGGRAMRPYVDPLTGQGQGTVIFEGIPYIGSDDSTKDERLWERALANCVTMHAVLKGTFVHHSKYQQPSTRVKYAPVEYPSLTIDVTTYTSIEDTVTVGLLIDRAGEKYSPKDDLTPGDILRWATGTLKKTAKLLNSLTEEIWDELPDGTFKRVERENGTNINAAIKLGLRGLRNPDGSLIASSLIEFLLQNGLRVAKGDLNTEVILKWARDTKKKTGALINDRTKEVWNELPGGLFVLVAGETGRSIDSAFRRGSRGLRNPDGSRIASSLDDFLLKNGLKAEKPILTTGMILKWASDTERKTGKPLTGKMKEVWCELEDGSFGLVAGETGKSIDQAFRKGYRGLCGPNGRPIAASLDDFLVRNGRKRASVGSKSYQPRRPSRKMARPRKAQFD